MLPVFIFMIGMFNLALGYALGVLLFRPDLAWAMRHRARFAAQAWAERLFELGAASRGFVTRLARRAPAKSTS